MVQSCQFWITFPSLPSSNTLECLLHHLVQNMHHQACMFCFLHLIHLAFLWKRIIQCSFPFVSLLNIQLQQKHMVYIAQISHPCFSVSESSIAVVLISPSFPETSCSFLRGVNLESCLCPNFHL